MNQLRPKVICLVSCHTHVWCTKWNTLSIYIYTNYTTMFNVNYVEIL